MIRGPHRGLPQPRLCPRTVRQELRASCWRSEGTRIGLHDYQAAGNRLRDGDSDRGHRLTRCERNPTHKKRLRRLVDTRVREAMKDDRSIATLARRA